MPREEALLCVKYHEGICTCEFLWKGMGESTRRENDLLKGIGETLRKIFEKLQEKSKDQTERGSVRQICLQRKGARNSSREVQGETQIQQEGNILMYRGECKDDETDRQRADTPANRPQMYQAAERKHTAAATVTSSILKVMICLRTYDPPFTAHQTLPAAGS